MTPFIMIMYQPISLCINQTLHTRNADSLLCCFRCVRYAEDNHGNPTNWLVDDSVIQCNTFAVRRILPSMKTALMSTTVDAAVATDAAVETSPYIFLFAYSCCMVVVIIIGFPAFLLYRLW